jgi:hypothetical protein
LEINRYSFGCNICEENFDTKRDLMNHKKKQHYDRVAMCWRFASANCSYADTDCWFRHYQTAQVTESSTVNCNLCDKELLQPNFNPKTKLVWPHNAVGTTTTHHRKFWGTFRQPIQQIFGMQPSFDPTRWNMVDNLNIFENQRQLQFFFKWKKTLSWKLENGRQPPFFGNWRPKCEYCHSEILYPFIFVYCY